MLDTRVHPADELAEIRNEMRRLEAREAELQAGYLAGRLPAHGLQYKIDVRTRVERTFLPERLPEALLLDADLWQEREVRSVVVRDC